LAARVLREPGEDHALAAGFAAHGGQGIHGQGGTH
jgi:hypothetical protein